MLAPFDGAPRVFQWHADTFDLRGGGVLLSEGDDVPNQTFRVGSAYAIQFHPEATEGGSWHGATTGRTTSGGDGERRRRL